MFCNKIYNVRPFSVIMNLLFVCNQNKNRSKTAEQIFKEKYNTKSAGLYTRKPVSEKQLAWSDVIIVMEEEQRSEIAKRFPKHYLQKRILALDIPDEYQYNNPKLIAMLKEKVSEYSELLT
jgi:predicted protein tyrosine phosphatase